MPPPAAPFDNTDWSTNHALRLKCLQQLQRGLRAVESELKRQIAAETGAPLGICGAMGPHCEIPIGFIDYTLKTLPEFQWSRDIGIAEMMGGKSRRLVEKEAIGVVACVTPWNVPLQINLAKCVPALAAGCSVVLKAAPDTPWSATMLGRVISQHTDIPAGCIQCHHRRLTPPRSVISWSQIHGLTWCLSPVQYRRG